MMKSHLRFFRFYLSARIIFSDKKRLRLPRRCAPRNDIFNEIATLLIVARNERGPNDL